MDLQAWSKPCFRSFFHTFFCRAKISPVASNHAFGSFPSDPGAVIIQRHFSGQNHTSLAPGPVPQHLMRLPGVSSKQQPFLRWFFSWKMIGKETQETKSIVSLWSLDGDCKVESTCIYIYILYNYTYKNGKTIISFEATFSILRLEAWRRRKISRPTVTYVMKLSSWNYEITRDIHRLGIVSFSKATILVNAYSNHPQEMETTGCSLQNNWILGVS